jgi:hypothetical protein
MKRHMRFGNQEITIEPIAVPEGEVFDPAAFLEQVMHDCPECRAARARGETPIVITPDAPPAKRDVIRDRRPRWRDLKRRTRR